MIIFKDIISGDELFTDSFKIIRRAGLVEIDCKMMSEKADIDDALIGGNASAEEASEDVDPNEVKGYDVAIMNRLASQPKFDKKGYLAHLKKYLKAIKAKMQENGRPEEDIKTFEKQMAEHVKKIAKNISDMEVFSGESMNAEGMQVLVDYREDNVTPYAIFIEEGLLEEKA